MISDYPLFYFIFFVLERIERIYVYRVMKKNDTLQLKLYLQKINGLKSFLVIFQVCVPCRWSKINSSDYGKIVVGLFLSRSSYIGRLDGMSPSITLAVFGGKFVCALIP